MSLLETIPESKWRYKVPEYRLRRQPSSLRELLEAAQSERCLIWLRPKEKDLFIAVRDALWCHVGDFMGWSFGVWKDAWMSPHMFRLHSKSTRAVENSFLFRLADDHYDGFKFSHNDFPTAKFPFRPSFIKTILRSNPHRQNEFSEFEFTSKQSAALAKQEFQVRLALSDCVFEDDGKVFYKNFQERDEHFGSLAFMGDLPLRGNHWTSFLWLLNEEISLVRELRLEGLDISASDCLLLARVNVLSIELKSCVLQDDAKALIGVIGRGEAAFDKVSVDGLLGSSRVGNRQPLARNQIVNAILSAIGEPACIVKHIRVGYPSFHSPATLIQAIQNNDNLETLCLSNPNIPSRFWDDLLEAVASHRGLRKVSFDHMLNFDRFKLPALAETLSKNRDVEIEIVKEDVVNDDFRAKWDLLVLPILKYNRFHRGVRRLSVVQGPRRRSILFNTATVRNRQDPTRISLLLGSQTDLLLSSIENNV